MRTRLSIDGSSYRLSRHDGRAWTESAVLDGGADALLPGDRLVNPGALELAIERAEDWIMPLAATLRGADLEVVDATGRLARGLQSVFALKSRHWDTDQLEALFLQLDYTSARSHTASTLQGRQDFVADIVLLRELAHHAQLREIRLSVQSAHG